MHTCPKSFPRRYHGHKPRLHHYDNYNTGTTTYQNLIHIRIDLQCLEYGVANDVQFVVVSTAVRLDSEWLHRNPGLFRRLPITVDRANFALRYDNRSENRLIVINYPVAQDYIANAAMFAMDQASWNFR